MKDKFISKMIGSLLIVSFFAYSCNNNATVTTDDDDSLAKADTGMNMNNIDTSSAPMAEKAEATLNGTYPDTTVTGSAKFEVMADGKVKMMLELTVASKAGKNVAVHLHEDGSCDDHGKASHGHWNPTNTQHGKWGENSFHSGDIGNVKLDSKGKGTLTLETDFWTLGGRADKNILGKAIIVHGGEDDYKSQPSGNAGERIGCGVIR